MWNIYLVFIDWQQQTLRWNKDIKQFRLLKMLCCIGLLRWDSAEMVSVMPVIYSVTCCIISFHSLTLIKNKGILLPVNLYSSQDLSFKIRSWSYRKQNNKKKPIKNISPAIQKYPFYRAIQHYWLLADNPMVGATYAQYTINRRNPVLSIARLQHCCKYMP